MTSLYTIDEHGRAVVDSKGLFELWFQGLDETGLAINSDPEIEAFNAQCRAHDKDSYLILPDQSVIIPHAQRVQEWLIPEEYKTLDVRQWCLSLCSDDIERARVIHEMRLFDFYGMVPVLQSLVHMVNVFREKKIVWGLGRGSSVASFVLYLIGVHKIHSIRFGLEVEDFLR